jgi:uncharacterized protein
MNTKPNASTDRRAAGCTTVGGPSRDRSDRVAGGIAMEFAPGRYHMELASGRFLDLSAPDASVIVLEDVAWGLSHACRFAGQCRTLYSVAEHALLVASRLEEQGHGRRVCLAGLHHDDAEAFIGDVTQPLKNLLCEYRAIEAAVFAAVVEALGLAELPFEHPAVKEADAWALAHEARELMPSRGESWWTAGLATGRLSELLGVTPELARLRWLDRHRALTNGCVRDGR